MLKGARTKGDPLRTAGLLFGNNKYFKNTSMYFFILFSREDSIENFFENEKYNLEVKCQKKTAFVCLA